MSTTLDSHERKKKSKIFDLDVSYFVSVGTWPVVGAINMDKSWVWRKQELEIVVKPSPDHDRCLFLPWTTMTAV